MTVITITTRKSTAITAPTVIPISLVQLQERMAVSIAAAHCSLLSNEISESKMTTTVNKLAAGCTYCRQQIH